MPSSNHRYVVYSGGILLWLGLLIAAACTNREHRPQMVTVTKPKFDLQGHRGARGLYPENTIVSALKALEIGVTTLELDVVISADSQVVVSHESYISATICSHSDGRPVTRAEERDLRLFAMTFDQIRRFDCGSRGHPDFPEQLRTKAHKPLLADLISASEARSLELNRAPVRYNIETKSSVSGDGVDHPEPSTFVRLVVDVVNGSGIAERATFQSFDPRTLTALHSLYRGMKTSLVIDRTGDRGLASNLATLDFSPDAYSPDYVLIDSSLIEAVHLRGMRIIPWTVNDEAEMARLIAMGVDGLITDYPDRGMRVLENL